MPLKPVRSRRAGTETLSTHLKFHFLFPSLLFPLHKSASQTVTLTKNLISQHKTHSSSHLLLRKSLAIRIGVWEIRVSLFSEKLQMPEEEDLVELKFRLYDGSDIGPIRYALSSTVAMLKERIISEWPKDKKITPKVANDVKLISGGKILENQKTVAQCRPPFGELPGGVITMHVVVQPSSAKSKTEKKADELPTKTGCSCSIL